MIAVNKGPMSLDSLRRFLYYPERLAVNAPLPRCAQGAEDAWITTADGETLHGLYWPPAKGRPTVLFFHGNAGHAHAWAAVRREMVEMDSGLLLIDYRGYGKSSGAPREDGLYLDARAAAAWLAGLGTREEDVVLFGKSLGGAVAAELAQGRAFRGLVLESAFTSIDAVARRLFPVFPVGALFPDRYDTVAKLPAVRVPVFVIHGLRDTLIPYQQAEALNAAANPPKELWLVRGAGHNDLSWVAGAEYGKRLMAWLPPRP